MLELLHPGLLWALGLALPLIILYILKARRSRRTVSSTWLWQEVHKDLEARVPFRRLRRDWLLWLQLLILILLVLAAAGPYRRTQLSPGGLTAVVLDASASLSAAETFEPARRTAAKLVDTLGPGDRMVLVRSAATTEVLVPATGDRRQLHAALEDLRPAAAPGRLAPAVELAASLVGSEGAVVVITDTAAEVGVEGVRVVRVGSNAGDLGNAGIVALGVSPADPSGRNHEVFVRLFNAAEGPVRGRLRLLLNGALRDAAEVEIPAGGETGRVLNLLDVHAGLLEVVWESTSARDALEVDDRAFWVLRSPPPRRVRISGNPDPFLLRALATNPAWQLADADEDADLEIAYDQTPAAVGPPLLWIDPRGGSQDGTVEIATVLTWDRTHPALRFVELRAVRFGSLRRYQRPPGARVLAETAAGPLILDARIGERPALQWAFDPADSDLPLRAAFPLLVHNALEYLSPVDGGLPGGLATGIPRQVRWPERGPARLLSPSGRELELDVEAGLLRLPPLEEIGTWTLAGDDREVEFGASLLDAGESDLRPAPETETQGDAPTPGRRLQTETTLRGIWRPLAFLALGLLLLEGAAFHRRWTP